MSDRAQQTHEFQGEGTLVMHRVSDSNLRSNTSDAKFTIAYDMDDQWRVLDWRFTPPLETADTYTQVEALTLMWALEADPKRADQGYLEWRRRG